MADETGHDASGQRKMMVKLAVVSLSGLMAWMLTAVVIALVIIEITDDGDATGREAVGRYIPLGAYGILDSATGKVWRRMRVEVDQRGYWVRENVEDLPGGVLGPLPEGVRQEIEERFESRNVRNERPAVATPTPRRPVMLERRKPPKSGRSPSVERPGTDRTKDDDAEGGARTPVGSVTRRKIELGGDE